LADAYYDNNLPVVKERLAAAGVRLAKLLNTILVGGDIAEWRRVLSAIRIA
jgi:hypothetical protein